MLNLYLNKFNLCSKNDQNMYFKSVKHVATNIPRAFENGIARIKKMGMF